MAIQVVITGASGFIGTNLRTYLGADEVFRVSCLSLRGGVDLRQLEGANAVVHLAGKAHDLKSASDPEEYQRVNYELSANLFDAFLASGCRKFIYMSSVKAVADTLDGVLKEGDIPHPGTPYGQSKLRAEEYMRSVSLPADKSCYILRPCMVHGPGNKGNLNLLYRLVRMGIPYPLGAFTNRRSYLGIENLCFVIRELIEREDIPQGTYNVADDEALSTAEVVRLISVSMKRRSRIWSIPKGLIAGIARLGDRLHLPLTTERLGKLVSDYVVSNEKVRNALQKNLPRSSKEGLKVTFKSFSES